MLFSLADKQKEGQLRDRHQQLGSTRSGSNKKKPSSYPTEFYCPISHCLMLEPVMDREGNTYERTSIEQWLSKHNTSPITRNSLNANHLVVNRALVGLIESELKRSGDQPELEKRSCWLKKKERKEKERKEKECREKERQQQLQQQRQQQRRQQLELERRRVLQEQRDSRRRISTNTRLVGGGGSGGGSGGGNRTSRNRQRSNRNGSGFSCFGRSSESDIIARVEAARNKITKNYRRGEVYYGQMKYGKSNGYGTYTFANGSKYVGEWKNDKQDGNGTYTWPSGSQSGSRYVGEYKNGRMHGQGTLTKANGTIYHSGEWVNDKPGNNGIVLKKRE